MVFLSAAPGDNGENDTVAQIVSPAFEASDARWVKANSKVHGVPAARGAS